MTESNGLYPGKVFQIDMRNLNISAKSTKDGMIYYGRFEMTREDFDRFSDADLTGSLFVAPLECVEVGEKKTPKEPKLKGGTLSQSAAILCKDPDFSDYVRQRLRDEGDAPAPDALYVEAQALYKWCKIQSRAEFDHNSAAQVRFFEVTHAFECWRRKLSTVDA
jgi:hypothetical protein